MLQVTCAIIEKNGKILCAQRSEKMNLPLKWEFPGGKIEENESLEACLKREIRELKQVFMKNLLILFSTTSCIFSKILLLFLPPQKTWCDIIFSNYFIGSKDHLGFSGVWVFKQGESPTTI